MLYIYICVYAFTLYVYICIYIFILCVYIYIAYTIYMYINILSQYIYIHTHPGSHSQALQASTSKVIASPQFLPLSRQ